MKRQPQQTTTGWYDTTKQNDSLRLTTLSTPVQEKQKREQKTPQTRQPDDGLLVLAALKQKQQQQQQQQHVPKPNVFDNNNQAIKYTDRLSPEKKTCVSIFSYLKEVAPKEEKSQLSFKDYLDEVQIES